MNLVITKADGTLVDEVRYDYGYGEYIDNMDSGSCMDNTAVSGIPAAGSSSKVSFMLKVDPLVMTSAENDVAANWIFSTNVYDEDGGQIGTPGDQNDAMTTSVNQDFYNDQIALYPNPAHDLIYLVSDIKSDFAVQIYDLVGKQVSQVELKERTLDVSQLEAGIYIVKIDFDVVSVAKRIVIQK